MTASAPATHTSVIASEEELRAVIGYPIQRVVDKVQPRLAPLHRQWIAASPFCVVATSAAGGGVDASPKGDPAGLAHVLDDSTVVIPERPGNKRADGYLNILANPHVGLIFLIPGRTDTLRVNGTARLVSDEAQAAAAAYRLVEGRIGAALAACASGQELIGWGYPSDVTIAAELDASQAVPTLWDGWLEPQ